MVEPKKAGAILDRRDLPGFEYYCPKHGKYNASPVQYAGQIFHGLCPACGAEEDEKEASVADEKLRREEKEAESRRVKRLEKMNIGKRNWGSSFENFDAYTPELKRHLKTCIEYAVNPGGRKLVMLGNNGTGKNHLAVSILKITGGVLYKTYEIELRLRQSYSGDTREYEVIKELCGSELLVIDELGRTKTSEWELNWLSYVVDKRHENLLPVVFISNKHLKDGCPKGGCADCLHNWVGNDILSRIIEDGLVMNFTGEDYREKIRGKRFGKKEEG